MTAFLLIWLAASIICTVVILAACVASGRNRRHLAILLFVLWFPFVATAPQVGEAVACTWECGGGE